MTEDLGDKIEKILNKPMSRKQALAAAIGALGIGFITGTKLNKLATDAEANTPPGAPYYEAAKLEAKLAGKEKLEPGEQQKVMIEIQRPDRDYPLFKEAGSWINAREGPFIRTGRQIKEWILDEGPSFEALRYKGGQTVFEGQAKPIWYIISGAKIKEADPKIEGIDTRRAYFVAQPFVKEINPLK